MQKTTFYLLPLILLNTPGFADPAEVVAAELRPAADGWTVTVTLRHGDTGWDDYADGWRVLDESGNVLGTRELLHPHVNEQPFSRSLSGVDISTDLATVLIESSTNTTGWGGETLRVSVPDR